MFIFIWSLIAESKYEMAAKQIFNFSKINYEENTRQEDEAWQGHKKYVYTCKDV